MPDDDLARLLPEPPPPRASRREAAIGAAMRRFDGVAEPAVPRPATAWQRPAWTRPSHTQIGAFASIALVAVVGLPLALTTLQQKQFPAPREPAPASTVAARTAPAAAARGTVATPPPQGTPARKRDSVPRGSGESLDAGPPALPPPPPAPVEDCGKGDCAPATRGFTDPRGSSFASPKRASEPSAADQEIVATGSRIAPRAAAAAPVTAVARDESEGMDIIVTGARSTRPAASYRRGDWNACTVNDPGESLDGCKRLVDPGARGVAGQAAAHVSTGLALAWHGDLDGAISEFDAAIALQPRLAFAYLNRGMAYQRQGEPERALDDLNRAVRYAPYAARNYYARSLFFREKGDIDRARADEERAVQRDDRYRAVVE